MNLPGILQDIADAAGIETAETLARARGGTEVSVPKHPRESSPIVKLVGMEAAQTLAKMFGAETILIPQGDYRGAGERRGTVRKMIRAGDSASQIALAAGVHERTVRRERRLLRLESQQHRLPGL